MHRLSTVDLERGSKNITIKALDPESFNPQSTSLQIVLNKVTNKGRRANHLSLAVDKRVPGVSRGVGDGAVLAGDGVVELHAGTKAPIQGRFDNDHVVVARRGEVFAFDFGDRQHKPPGFDLPIGQA